MTDLFKTLSCIYTSTNTNFIQSIDDGVSHFALNVLLSRFLVQQNKLLTVSRLSRAVYYLDTKEYCGLAWSLIQPKLPKSPFVKKISKNDDITEYDFLLDKVKKHLEISNNDWLYCKDYFIKDVKENTFDYLVFFGCSKKEWKLLGQDYENQRKIATPEIKEGLEKWF